MRAPALQAPTAHRCVGTPYALVLRGLGRDAREGGRQSSRGIRPPEAQKASGDRLE